MKRALAILLGLGLLAAAPAAAQVPVVAEGPIRISLTGRIQPQFNTSTADSVYSTFELRRARVGVEVVIDRWIEGRVEWNFAHSSAGDVTSRLEDAFVDHVFDDAFRFQVGQFKKPFSRHDLTGSSRSLPVETGLRIRGLDADAEHHLLLDENVYVGREIGAQIHGILGPVGYAAGVFNGSDQNARDVNDAKSYAARLTLKPFRFPFEIGAAASYRDRAVVDPLTDETETDTGLAIEVDAQWGGFRHPGPYVLLEGMQAENFMTADPMVGGIAIVAWFQPLALFGRVEGIEPLVRASYGDPSTHQRLLPRPQPPHARLGLLHARARARGPAQRDSRPAPALLLSDPVGATG